MWAHNPIPRIPFKMSLVKRNPEFFKNRKLKVMSKTEIKTTPADENHFHSIFGASGAKRWRLCPGSVNVIEAAKAAGQIPKKDTGTEFSNEGTTAHDWAEKVLTGKITMEEIPEEFRIHLAGYINHCFDLSGKALLNGGTVYNEASVPLFYRPEDTGTLDFATIKPEQMGFDEFGEEAQSPTTIDFVDLKYGAGIKVDAEDNEQLAIYLLSLVNEIETDQGEEFPDDTIVRLAIYQPRHHTFDGEAETWETTLREVKDLGIDIEADYQRAKAGGESTLNPSDDACQFCDVKGICTARAQKRFDPMVDFADDTTPEMKVTGADTLTPEQIAFFILNGKAMKKVIDDVEKHERARLQDGGEVQQMKMVDGGGLSPKKWLDEKAAEAFLKGQLSANERYQPRKLISAPQAFAKIKSHVSELSTIAKAKMGLLDDAAAKKTKTECLFHRAPKSPILVSVEDTRDAIVFTTPEDDFDASPVSGDDELDSLM